MVVLYTFFTKAFGGCAGYFQVELSDLALAANAKESSCCDLSHEIVLPLDCFSAFHREAVKGIISLRLGCVTEKAFLCGGEVKWLARLKLRR